MADTADPFHAELLRLRQAYLDRLPAEFAELAAFATALGDGTGAGTALDALHSRLHKLAGSGGTFGLGRLSREARALESQAKEWLGSGENSQPEGEELRRFVAAISALPSAVEDAPLLSVSMNAPVQVTRDGQMVHIWLVEDDAPLGQELARSLTQFGYEVVLFTRLSEAEQAARVANPDVLVMDVMFPEEGLNATEVVHTYPAFRDLGCPILFISSCGDFSSRIRAARRGAAGFLTKPLDVPKLVDRLETILERSKAAPFRVLIVDDDTALAGYYRLVLEAAGVEVDTVSEPEAVIEHIVAFRPELVLMDMHMPGYTGAELALVIRQYDEWIGLPIVYLSAETDIDEQIRAVGLGADDFLTKPISESHLVAAVRVRVNRFRQLAALMSKDSLTGLLKHSRIKEELEVELARSRRSGRPFNVAMLDIDHFKGVNDTYGHAVGDQVIKAVAHLLRQRLRMTDIIGRYGGEEFVVLLPDCDGQAARAIIEDIRVRFSGLRFHHGEREFNCTISAGVAGTDCCPGLDGGNLLVAADKALYAAKGGGRNRVELALGDGCTQTSGAQPG